MKISKVVSQTKEYNRLQGLITNIEFAIKNIGKPKEDPTEYIVGTTTLSGYNVGTTTLSGYNVGTITNTKTVDVYLNSGVTELISDDLKSSLKVKLIVLKTQQEMLEV